MIDEYDDLSTPVGAVVDQDRGSLPFALIHGEPLVACAGWGLESVGVRLLDEPIDWSEVLATGSVCVLHDALCPMTPPSFLAQCLRAVAPGGVVIGVRPVTDTVKVVRDGFVGSTVDREGLWVVTSPIVLSPQVCAVLGELPTTDFVALATQLRRDFPATLLTAPPHGRRVASPEDLTVLEALTGPARFPA